MASVLKKDLRNLAAHGGLHGSRRKSARSADLKLETSAQALTVPHFTTSLLLKARRTINSKISSSRSSNFLISKLTSSAHGSRNTPSEALANSKKWWSVHATAG